VREELNGLRHALCPSVYNVEGVTPVMEGSGADVPGLLPMIIPGSTLLECLMEKDLGAGGS
jgi:hypothetical protein